MECREAREMAHAACDGELSASDKQRLMQHLSVCRTCDAYDRTMRSLKGRLKAAVSAADLSAAEAVLERVTASGNYGQQRGFFSRGFFRPGILQAAAAAALVVGAVFAGLSLFTPSESVASMIVKHHRLRLVGRLVLETHANCCKDLDEWFESRSGRPVHIPEIQYKGMKIEGGHHYEHGTGNYIFLAAYSLEGKPVTLCVCTGPNILTGSGKAVPLGGRTVNVETGSDYTLMSWRSGEVVNVLVTPFDEEKSREVLASIEEI